MKYVLLIVLFTLVFVDESEAQVVFPTIQPQDGNFNRPLPGERLDISPPGFCWWRAAPRGSVQYRLRIEDDMGELAYESGVLDDPVHIPTEVLSSGHYSWIVDALDSEGKVVSSRPSEDFSIEDDAHELPWIDPEILLDRIPSEYPRLIFPRAKLTDIRASLRGSRSVAYADLKKVAEQALSLELMEKPDFDKFDIETEYPARRTAYRASYQEFTRIYNRGMVPMALMYLLSTETKYGAAAKKHLLHVLGWELDGIASLDEGFDEVGLRIARTAAQGYDWLYDLFTPEEREAVRQMLLARGDQMLDRMQRRDFLHKSAYSHDGRLPGYLLEFSIVLAEEERAKVWMDYAMRALLTVFPHWGGKDGGWAEGINYVLSYNDRFITPLQSLYEATGYDLWNKSYFRKMRHFLMYCVSPLGEIAPFGDAEHNPIKDRAGDLYSILKFHALHYRDPTARWWIEELDGDREKTARLGVMHRIIHGDDLEPLMPEQMDQDRAFDGVGWAALHSNIMEPKNDLMVLFKSSPYGAVSHSHADQNGFAIMKGGKALAQPSGARYPQHQSPFHFEYTNLTVAHNAVLINGQGQINRDASAHGKLIAFKTSPHLGYTAGDAQKCYGDRLDRYHRHVIMIRPSIIMVIDDLSGSAPFSVDWLMHAREEMTLDEDLQRIESTRMGEAMRTEIYTSGQLDFSLNNDWPIDPKQDYPMVTAPPPAKEWHFSASTRETAKKRRIVTIMKVKEGGKYPNCQVRVEDGHMHISGHFSQDAWSANINMDAESDADAWLLELEYQPESGMIEKIRIPN